MRVSLAPQCGQVTGAGSGTITRWSYQPPAAAVGVCRRGLLPVPVVGFAAVLRVVSVVMWSLPFVLFDALAY